MRSRLKRMWKRTSARAIAATLFITVVCLSAVAQEGEHAAPVSTRGDKHSEGWAKAMRLRLTSKAAR